MLRTVIGVLASVLLVGSLGAAPAVADHGGKKPPQTGHEAIPTDPTDFVPAPEGACTWKSSVSVDDQNGNGGISADEVNHNHYVSFLVPPFDSIDCTSPTNPVLDQSFNMEVDGGTDGVVPMVGHGENVSIGWSNSSGYGDGSITAWDGAAAASCDARTPGDQNKGDIWVAGLATGNQASGWMKFVRQGAELYAWGCLGLSNGKANIVFQAWLQFIPEVGEVTDLGDNKMNIGRLAGVATVGTSTL